MEKEFDEFIEKLKEKEYPKDKTFLELMKLFQEHLDKLIEEYENKK